MSTVGSMSLVQEKQASKRRASYDERMSKRCAQLNDPDNKEEHIELNEGISGIGKAGDRIHYDPEHPNPALRLYRSTLFDVDADEAEAIMMRVRQNYQEKLDALFAIQDARMQERAERDGTAGEASP